MYNSLFDIHRQSDMRNYFLCELSKHGTLRRYEKNELINIDMERYVAIVVSGVISQNILSSKGNEKLLYLIRPGEIFGETYYFCGGKNTIIMRAKNKSVISILNEEVLDNILEEKPQIYRYFIHSITRKFRIVMLGLTNNTFNDSTGRIADAILRLASCADPDDKGRVCINMVYTHQELANNIGCSRITVTRCLKKFSREKLISFENRKIIINNPDQLKKYIDIVVED